MITKHVVSNVLWTEPFAQCNGVLNVWTVIRRHTLRKPGVNNCGFPKKMPYGLFLRHAIFANLSVFENVLMWEHSTNLSVSKHSKTSLIWTPLIQTSLNPGCKCSLGIYFCYSLESTSGSRQVQGHPVHSLLALIFSIVRVHVQLSVKQLFFTASYSTAFSRIP
jgi:hypothetical protein